MADFPTYIAIDCYGIEGTTEPATMAKIARGAADAIDHFGWTQRIYGEPKVGFCAVGAIAFASPGGTFSDTCWTFNGWLVAHKPGSVSVTHWNDYICTNGSEVAAALREFAVDQENPNANA